MENEIRVYDAFKQELEVFKAADAEKVFDETTTKGYADCKAYHVKLRKVWNSVDRLRLSTTASMRQDVKDANQEGFDILAEIDKMANPRKAQLDAEDAREQKIIDDLAAAAEAKKAKEEADRIEEFNRKQKELDDKLAAINAEADARKTAEDAAEAAKQIEADKLAAVEQAKRKAEIDAINAKVLADKALTDATEKAKKDKADAILEIKRKAHEAKGELAAQQLKEKNDAQAVLDEAAKVEAERIADSAHRENIERELAQSIVDECLHISPDHAELVLDALKTGKIKHVTINY